MPTRLGRLSKPIWIVAGALALALGAIGVILPVLPTTPFVIFAAFAFARSSPRLAHRLETHAVFGPIIADWRQNGAIAPKYKAMALGMMLMALGISLALSIPAKILAIQAVCLIAASLYILSRPNGPSDPPNPDQSLG